MFSKVESMFHDYRNFKSNPGFINLTTLFSAAEDNRILLPIDFGNPGVSEKDCIKNFNNQLRNMSNTASSILALNIDPKIKQGKNLFNHKVTSVKSDGYILAYGYRAIKPFLLAFNNSEVTYDIYYSFDENKFLTLDDTSNQTPLSHLISINKLYGKAGQPTVIQNPSHLIGAKNIGISNKNKIKTELRAKMMSYIFFAKVCDSLTNYQQDGWSESLYKRSNDAQE